MYTKEERRSYTNQWRAQRKLYALSKLGNQCAICKSKVELEFDHIDPQTKTDGIANLWTASNVKFEAELDKCQLLCKPCHINKTRVEATTTSHGTFSMYQRQKCRCTICKEFYNAYSRTWKQNNKRR